HDLPGLEPAVAEANGSFSQDSIEVALVGLVSDWHSSLTPGIITRGKPENTSFECIAVIKKKYHLKQL
ncbi:hypothetical protein Q8G81_34260, partial [Klebsiella pneumoniae]